MRRDENDFFPFCLDEYFVDYRVSIFGSGLCVINRMNDVGFCDFVATKCRLSECDWEKCAEIGKNEMFD